ncbi:MAG: hypothetical protein HYV60_09765 [Planctomycetia bacterium]|nr:hypothetical protein [Planctomycetia bacterium]
MITNRVSISRCLLVVAVSSLAGCGGSDEIPTVEVRRAVYVDTKTLKAMVCDVTNETPAVNPATGQRTLMPALYCPKCLRWHPLPPLDQINRTPNATKCSKTGATLTADGPWPE